MSLDEKFDKVMARYDELRDTLAAGLAESGDFARLSKEYADLTPIAEAIAELKKGRAEAADLAEMIADPGAEVAQRFGIWVEKTNYGRKYMGVERTTIVIGKDGTIKKVFPKVSVDGHVEEVLAALD